MSFLKKYKFCWLLFAGLVCSMPITAQQMKAVTEKGIHCTYTLKKGKLTGPYVSHYANGIKKAAGNLQDGYRTGTWTVWDSFGRKRMERFYKNPFEYKRIFPVVPNTGPIPMLFENDYKMEYDTNGVIKYAVIKAEDAVWRHKYWRILYRTGNEIVFNNDFLLKQFARLIATDSLIVYDPIDDRFTTPINRKRAIELFDTLHSAIAGFEIKEEHIFDMNRLVAESRILGICPLIKTDRDTLPAGWIYYPDARKSLGKIKLPAKEIPSYIHTLDDLFIFRHFSSVIIKTTYNNPYDKLMKSYCTTAAALLTEQEIQMLNIIENENDLWIWLTK